MDRSPRSRCARGVLLLIAMLCAIAGARAQPFDADHEGALVIYAATDRSAVQPLLDDFAQVFDGLRVEYHDLNSVELYERFIAEAGRGGYADVVWSSAMDLQVKLVNDGYAQPHRSLQTDALPPWASWKNEAFGTTWEPIALAYDTRQLPSGEVPATHAELAQLLAGAPGRFDGRVVTYDPRRSGVGLLLHSQDRQSNPIVFRALSEALGSVNAVQYASVSEMLDAVVEGRAAIAYNVLGSYALTRARSEPTLGVVLLHDYTLVMSRVVFIARSAPHPKAARLWVDYLLSPRGQAMLARNAGFFSVRNDISGPDMKAAELRERLGDSFRPIALGPSLLTYLDRMKRRAFLKQWHDATAARH